MAKVHELKCWSDSFWAVKRGTKTHEVRKCSDRVFEVGDILVLQEYIPGEDVYTGQTCWVSVTYVTESKSFGLPEDVVVLSVRRHETGEATRPLFAVR